MDIAHDPGRVSAVLNAPAPKNVAKLQSYLGMLNYYGQFIPSLATTLGPLHRLLRHGDLRQYRAVRDRPQGLLRVLIMLIRTDFPALRGGTVPLSARYGRC